LPLFLPRPIAEESISADGLISVCPAAIPSSVAPEKVLDPKKWLPLKKCFHSAVRSCLALSAILKIAVVILCADAVCKRGRML
jgi:hypothetical protein